MVAKRLSLAHRRKAVGHTQESLAAALGVERSTVVRWESGETDPLPWCRPKLAEALAVSLDALNHLLTTLDDVPTQHSAALLLSQVGSMSAAQIGALMERFAAMDVASRREVLQELVILSGAALLEPVRRWLAQALTVVPLISPDSVSRESLDALEKVVVLFRRWDASGLGGQHRKAVVGQLKALTETLHERHKPEVRRRLFHLAAELAHLAGWMSYDQNLPGAAQRYYLLGLSACKEAQSPVFAAKTLGSMAQLATAHGHREDSLDLIHTALYILPRQNGSRVRAELLGLQSRAHAHLGNHTATIRAAETSIETWQDTHKESSPPWLGYLNQSEIDCLAANAYIELAFFAQGFNAALAHAERAERHTRNACENRKNSYARSRVFDEIRLAKVRLAQRDLGEAITVAQSALELAAPMSSTLVFNRLHQFHSEVTTRYPDSKLIIPFSEQLRQYIKN